MSEIRPFVIGVDIGGTKTRVATAPVDDATGALLEDVIVASAAWRPQLGDARADAMGLRNLLVRLLGDAALHAPLAVGAHGCDNASQCDELAGELRTQFFGPVVVVNDSELMPLAVGQVNAIGVVVGTGSIATARTASEQLITAGGWGWLLGDEGSAPGLVRDAVTAALSHLDRGGAIDPLIERLMAAFGAGDAAELALAATQDAGAESWGQHAPEVFAAADEGSTLALLVIESAGAQLAQLVRMLFERGVAARAIVAGGSVIEKQPRLQNALRTALARTHPDIPFVILDQPPVHGAIALARHSAVKTSQNPSRTESARA
ncbi:N-acetylglucosamine kinase [Microbacterium sp. NPDC012755]|uniref:N-acetylglucosamine kinase n=1 Tax=Microbacterium sp. NPDC012755 TaxID=3364184 RepID=UPI00367DF629